MTQRTARSLSDSWASCQLWLWTCCYACMQCSHCADLQFAACTHLYFSPVMPHFAESQTKLTLTVTLTLTDTVTVILFTRISLTAHKRLYRINERKLKWKWWKEKLTRHSAKRDSAKREDTFSPHRLRGFDVGLAKNHTVYDDDCWCWCIICAMTPNVCYKLIHAEVFWFYELKS